jgi:hypothetical protein
MTSYHQLARVLRVGRFLPRRGGAVTHLLSPRVRALKERMLGRFASQADTLAPFVAQLHAGTARERFRRAPRYDFQRRPHAGPLHYEMLGWLRCEDWCQLATQALHALDLGDHLLAQEHVP